MYLRRPLNPDEVIVIVRGAWRKGTCSGIYIKKLAGMRVSMASSSLNRRLGTKAKYSLPDNLYVHGPFLVNGVEVHVSTFLRPDDVFTASGQRFTYQ